MSMEEQFEAEEQEQAATEQTEEQQEAPAYDPETAEEAKLFGWKPRDEWKGEVPDTFVDDPSEYLGRIQNSRIFTAMQSKLEKQAEVTQRIEAMNQRALEQERQRYQSELDRIKQEKARAVETADVQTYNRLDQQEQQLSQAAPQEAPAQPEAPKEILEYRNSEDGAWLANPALGREAYEFIEAHPAYQMMPPLEQARAARDYLADKYKYAPEFRKAEEPKRATAPKVDPGGLGGGMSGGSKFGKLPAEAKQQAERFIKEGLYEDSKKGREEYANDYLG